MGLFDSFFAGSSGSAPSYAFQQPETRLQLFKLVLKERFWQLIPLNLLYLLFTLPTLVWSALQGLQLIRFLHLSQVEVLSQVLGVVYMLVLGLIPCILLLSPASAGIAYVTRNWARDQSAMLWKDFWYSAKQNWKQAFWIHAISAVFPLIAYWYLAFLSTNPHQLGISIFPAIVCALVALLWFMAVPTAIVLLNTYKLRLPAVIKNALIMTITHLPTSVGITILSWALPVLFAVIALFFSAPVGIMLFVIYVLLWGASLPWLLQSSYANRLCEEFLNAQLGEPTGIGIREE